MRFRLVLMTFLASGLLACSQSSSPEELPAIPEKWQHLKITEVGRTAEVLESDENELHIHFEGWTYAALLEDVIKRMKAAGYEHTLTRSDGRFYEFEKPGEQLMLKIDGGDGDLHVDIINGKGDGADRTMHELSIKRYSIAPQDPLKLESSFDKEAVKFVNEPGSASVTGQAFFILPDGALKSCAGYNIELLPVAAYSSERIFKTYGNNEQGQVRLENNPPKFTPDVKEYHEMLLKGSCDASGEFQFKNVAAGDYYVIAFIIWETTPGDPASKTGGGVMKKIHVEPGSSSVVRLN